MADTFWGKFMRSTKLCGLFFFLIVLFRHWLSGHTNSESHGIACKYKKCKCLGPRPDLVPVPGQCALALKGMLVRHRGAQDHIYFSFQFAAVLPFCHHRNFKSQGNMGKKHGTDEILCKQVPVSGYGAWILTLERVPVPGYRAHVFVQAPLKCYVHICTRAQAPNPGPSLDGTLTSIFTLGVVVQSPKPVAHIQ